MDSILVGVCMQPAERIVWCHYPFLLDARAKSVIMNVDCLLSMKVKCLCALCMCVGVLMYVCMCVCVLMYVYVCVFVCVLKQLN